MKLEKTEISESTGNPFVPKCILFLPLKRSENGMFSGVREKVHWKQMG